MKVGIINSKEEIGIVIVQKAILNHPLIYPLPKVQSILQ
jgi:hypothetical protein